VEDSAGRGSREYSQAGGRNSVHGSAFGGPIFYGHASQNFNEAPDHPKNVYWYQAKRANEVFQALDGKQRATALLGDPREEKGTATIQLKKRGEIPGLPVTDMTRDQRELVDRCWRTFCFLSARKTLTKR